MLKAGLRASEPTALHPENVDLMSGRPMVREGKGTKDRTLWVGGELLGELQEWTGRRSEDARESNFLLRLQKERSWRLTNVLVRAVGISCPFNRKLR